MQQDVIVTDYNLLTWKDWEKGNALVMVVGVSAKIWTGRT
jgi:hypothetical protein